MSLGQRNVCKEGLNDIQVQKETWRPVSLISFLSLSIECAVCKCLHRARVQSDMTSSLYHLWCLHLLSVFNYSAAQTLAAHTKQELQLFFVGRKINRREPGALNTSVDNEQ